MSIIKPLSGNITTITTNAIISTAGSSYMMNETTSGVVNIRLDSNDLQRGSPITIVDTTGTLDDTHYMHITTQNNESINNDANGVLDITSPYGSVTLFPDGTGWTIITGNFSTTIFSAISLATQQVPSGVNSEILIDLGSDITVGGVSNLPLPVQLLSSVITCFQSGRYNVYGEFLSGRNINGGAETISLMPFINGDPVKDGLYTKTVDRADERFPIIFSREINMNVGDTLYFELAALATQGQATDVGLYQDSTDAISGWIPDNETEAIAPSARITIKKIG